MLRGGRCFEGVEVCLGARYSRLSTLKAQAEDKVVALKGSLSEVEDIDLPKTITELQLQQTAYQAALAAPLLTHTRRDVERMLARCLDELNRTALNGSSARGGKVPAGT